MFRIMFAAVFTLSLAGCDSTNTRVSSVGFGSSTGIVTSGNLRLVTERRRAGYPPTVCTEPSPDYMVAFDRTRKFIATRQTAAGEEKIDLDASTMEEIVKGEGRTSGVMALRDGLYAACQSYANGVIGADAYAIILSQYGNLLVALVGSDSVAKNVQVSGPQAAISAMTVACISGHDPSRHGHERNPLLTPSFCRSLLDKVISRGAAGGGAKALSNVGRATTGNMAERTAAKPTVLTGSNVTTTTTTSTLVK